MAKARLHDTAVRLRLMVKDVPVAAPKIDSILLTRLDKIRKIMEVTGTYTMLPPLACQRNMVRVQGLDAVHIDRAIREIMSLVSFGFGLRPLFEILRKWREH
jgi:hypothetical protein